MGGVCSYTSVALRRKGQTSEARQSYDRRCAGLAPRGRERRASPPLRLPAWPAPSALIRDGRPVDPDALSKAFHLAAGAAGCGGVRLHDLRHGFATLLVAGGTDARVVSDLLGHSAVAFTLTYYHPSEDAAAVAVQSVEQALGWGESGANHPRR